MDAKHLEHFAIPSYILLKLFCINDKTRQGCLVDKNNMWTS